MRVIVKEDYQEMSQEAARVVARQVLLKPNSVLGLPTGNTPTRMYGELVSMYELGLIDFSGIVTFNLDEYHGLPQDHHLSYYHYMREKLFDHVNVPEGNVHIPDGAADDAQSACDGYEKQLSRYETIDLQVLGIGPNGHIGFNEPGTDWGMTVGLVRLSDTTRSREAPRFGGIENVPTYAITMGIKTIMRSKRILLLASGKEKAVTTKRAVEGPITKGVPASVLQLHPDVTLILDQEAASQL